MHFYNRMIDALWETAEFLRADYILPAFDFDNKLAFEDNKTLITFLMCVRRRVGPRLRCIVIPDLK